MVEERVSGSAFRDWTTAKGGRDIIDVIKGLSVDRLGLLGAGGSGSWGVGLHGQVFVVVVELQDLFCWALVVKFLSFGGR
jgi:hypothetical protein